MTSDLASQIRNSEKLTSIFGRWPSFHDGYLRQVTFEPSQDCVMKFKVFETTTAIDSRGFFIQTKHTVASIRFAECEALRVEAGFAGCIVFDLKIEPIRLEIRPGNGWAVELSASTDFHLTLRCTSIEVLEVAAESNS